MGRIRPLILLVLVLLCGCRDGALTIAIKTANGAYEVGETAADTLNETCTKPYEELAADIEAKRKGYAEGKAEFDALEAKCPKMKDAYRALRAAHLALLAATKAVQAGATLPALIPLTQKAVEAMTLISTIGAKP